MSLPKDTGKCGVNEIAHVSKRRDIVKVVSWDNIALIYEYGLYTKIVTVYMNEYIQSAGPYAI